MSTLRVNEVPIGEGGFGRVFLATIAGGKQIAVKLVRRGMPAQEILIANEVRALKAASGSRWAVELIYFQVVDSQALFALVSFSGVGGFIHQS